MGVTSAVGTGVVGTVEVGTADMAEMGVKCMAGGVAVGIAMSAATSSSLKVSAIRRTDIQNKGRLHQKVIYIYIYIYVYVYKKEKKEEGNDKKEKKKKRKKKKELNKIGEIHTPELGLMVTTLLLIRIRNPLLHGGFVIRILKNLVRSLRRRVCIRPKCSRARDGRRGNHKEGAILHSLR